MKMVNNTQLLENNKKHKLNYKSSLGIACGRLSENEENGKPAFYFKNSNIKIQTVFKNLFTKLEKKEVDDILTYTDPLNGLAYLKYIKPKNIIEIHLSLWYNKTSHKIKKISEISMKKS